MSSELQTVLALACVAVSAGVLIWRGLQLRKTTGCGGSCGCPSQEMRKSLKPDQPRS